MRCMVMAERICVKKSAVMLVSTSVLSDGSNGGAERLHLQDGRLAVAHVHLDRECDRDFGADILDLLPGGVRHPGHVDEQVVFADLDAFEGLAGEVGDVGADTGELIEDRADPERREDVRGDQDAELATDRPGLPGRRGCPNRPRRP